MLCVTYVLLHLQQIHTYKSCLELHYTFLKFLTILHVKRQPKTDLKKKKVIYTLCEKFDIVK